LGEADAANIEEPMSEPKKQTATGKRTSI
jgi:hypothetical protein